MATSSRTLPGIGLDEAFLRHVIDEHRSITLAKLQTLWMYYRNAMEAMVGAAGGGADGAGRGRWYTLAQERGLPARIVGAPSRHLDDRLRTRREVVVENDIAWRIQLMIDFMAGRPIGLRSEASSPETRAAIERVLGAIWEASGGITLLQNLALMGHVYGHVDVVLRIDEPALRALGGARADEGESPERFVERHEAEIARAIRMELVEPTRGIPVTSVSDYRRLDAYVIHVEHQDNALRNAATPVHTSHRLGRAMAGVARAARGVSGERRAMLTTTEVLTPGRRVVMRDERVVVDERLTLLGDVVPLVHIQNNAQPFRYGGIGEVEPLIPLQDELNTRLSDRACRVTMQSFKMYLAKGIEGFDRVGVGPGQIWSTDNPDAEVIAFGGDASSPSEDAHIEQIREAMDKVSGVPPLAGGVVRARIGNLSSANALRITLMSLLAKTERKRLAYGRGLSEACAMVLEALDGAGVLATTGRERSVRVEWPEVLPLEPERGAPAREAVTS